MPIKPGSLQVEINGVSILDRVTGGPQDFTAMIDPGAPLRDNNVLKIRADRADARQARRDAILQVPAAREGARPSDRGPRGPDPRAARAQQDRRLPARERHGALRDPGRGPARALQRGPVRRQPDRRRARREAGQGQLPRGPAGAQHRERDQRADGRDRERRAGRHGGGDPHLRPRRPARLREPLEPGDRPGLPASPRSPTTAISRSRAAPATASRP